MTTRLSFSFLMILRYGPSTPANSRADIWTPPRRKEGGIVHQSSVSTTPPKFGAAVADNTPMRRFFAADVAFGSRSLPFLRRSGRPQVADRVAGGAAGLDRVSGNVLGRFKHAADINSGLGLVTGAKHPVGEVVPFQVIPSLPAGPPCRRKS